MLIIGCDFHTRFEQIAMLDTETGEVVGKRLEHESGEAKRFYEGLREAALIGIESTGYTRWFAEMLAELGHELVMGEAGKIRSKRPRKQKHDRGDAEHLLNLVLGGDFPKVWLPPPEERDVRVLVEHRHQLVDLRTRAKNGLQAMALSYGIRKRRRLWSAAGQEELKKIPLREGMGRRREDLLRLLGELNAWVLELDQRIEEEVARREAARVKAEPPLDQPWPAKRSFQEIDHAIVRMPPWWETVGTDIVGRGDEGMDVEGGEAIGTERAGVESGQVQLKRHVVLERELTAQGVLEQLVAETAH